MGDAMVARSSYDDHVILEGCYIPDVMVATPTGVLTVAWVLWMMPSWVQSDMIGTNLWTNQVRKSERCR